jgi:hypothetical protein
VRLAGGERRWGRRPGRWSMIRGAGKWSMVVRCSWRRRGAWRGTGGGATWWLNGSGTRWRSGADRREEERLFTGVRAPFIAGRGSGRRAAHVGSVKPWAVCTCGRQLSGRWARAVLTGWAGTVDMGWVQSGAQPFSNYSNFAQILKYKTKTILMSINVQTCHGARVYYSEQLLPLGPLPIPNIIPVIKFGTNSTLNLSLNF